MLIGMYGTLSQHAQSSANAKILCPVSLIDPTARDHASSISAWLPELALR